MKILIADDEALARQRLKRLVEEINPKDEVFADAANGLEALEQCIKLQPHIAFLDIRMPKMDGLQAATEILKAKLDTHIVFVTAYDEYALEAFNKNAIDYLLKPVKKNRLEQSLAKISQLTINDSLLLDESLKTLEEEFGSLFFRVHRNALVNTLAIKAITKTPSGQFNLHLHGVDETLSISRRHRAELNKFLRQQS